MGVEKRSHLFWIVLGPTDIDRKLALLSMPSPEVMASEKLLTSCCLCGPWPHVPCKDKPELEELGRISTILGDKQSTYKMQLSSVKNMWGGFWFTRNGLLVDSVWYHLIVGNPTFGMIDKLKSHSLFISSPYEPICYWPVDASHMSMNVYDRDSTPAFYAGVEVLWRKE